MNLYEITMEVLEYASDNDISIDDEMSRQDIATQIYDLFYDYQVYSADSTEGYLFDLQEYWHYRDDLNEE